MSGVGMMLLGSGTGLTTPVITIADRIISDTQPQGGSEVALAGYVLNNNGIAYQTTTNSGTVSIGNWVTPTTSASDYETLATLISGTTPNGTLGSWLALSTTRNWSKTKSGIAVGAVFCTLQIDIRKTGTVTVLDTAQIQLVAEIV